MSVPKVAIVGRPNVGKSSIFNWLSRRQIAIVDPTAGVTRDRVNHLMYEDGRYFELIDTGGMGIVDDDNLSEQIEDQINLGLREADVIVFVVDGTAGVTPLDRHVSDRLRGIDKPMLLVINKCDSPKTDLEVPEFLGLTNAAYVITSVKGNRNRHELLEALVETLPPAEELEDVDGQSLAASPELNLAIVGRRNVGKSTFINQLAQEERVIVSEVPGTTRDSIDIRFELDGKTIVAIDTPGVRKRKSLANDIEFYSLVRAQRSIRRADVVLMLFDAEQTISKVDKQLVEEIHSECKPTIFVVNKWDLGLKADMTSERWAKYLIETFASMRHVPVAFITAIDGKNIQKIIHLAKTIQKQAQIRVSTGRLNKILRAAIKMNPPPMRKNRRPKIYFATQVATEPPTIVLKCNDPSIFDDSWKRYMLGVFREQLPFQEVPIRLHMRAKSDDEVESPAVEELPVDVAE